MSKSDIANFFADQTVFVTGGTGSVGKIFIEKLLRRCTAVRTIYVMIRNKKGKPAEERFRQLFDEICFESLHTNGVKIDEKVRLIVGDCLQSDLGISLEERRLLQKEVTVVVHIAANVRFDQTLRIAAYSNVRATQDAIELAKGMALLKAFIHISTAYSHCPRTYIDEKFYVPDMSPSQLFKMLDSMDDRHIDIIMPKLLTRWPNTYVYTKAIAEDVVKSASGTLPIAIIRPAIVCAASEEPIPGWVDNIYNITGITVGAGLGILKTYNAVAEYPAHVVPVDYVVNSILAAAWDVSTKGKETIPIYNYVGSETNVLTFDDMRNLITYWRWDYALSFMVGFPNVTLRANTLWNSFIAYFVHTLPAYAVDTFLMCTGKKSFAVKNLEKFNNMCALTSYFALRSFNFNNDNVQQLWTKLSDEDRRNFNFSMDNLDWRKYFKNKLHFARVHLMKDPMETLPKARRKLIIFGIVHYTFIILFYYLLYKFFTFVLNLFFLM